MSFFYDTSEIMHTLGFSSLKNKFYIFIDPKNFVKEQTLSVQ